MTKEGGVMLTVKVISATDPWLIGATILGALAVLAAARVAAKVSREVSRRQENAQSALTDRQNAEQYREGLNVERHRVYPDIIRWADKAMTAYANTSQGVPTAVELPDYALLWCCASPDLWKILKQLTDDWGGNLAQPPTGEEIHQIPGLINDLRLQARWDLFGKEGFEAGSWQQIRLVDIKDITWITPKGGECPTRRGGVLKVRNWLYKWSALLAVRSLAHK
jgi:hypothetical protein